MVGGGEGGLKRMILDFLAEIWPFSKFLDFVSDQLRRLGRSILDFVSDHLRRLGRSILGVGPPPPLLGQCPKFWTFFEAFPKISLTFE